MLKFIIPAALAALAFAGCGESYVAVNDNQVVVTDNDGSLDKRTIAVACAEAYLTDRAVAEVGKVREFRDGEMALVTCGPVQVTP